VRRTHRRDSVQLPPDNVASDFEHRFDQLIDRFGADFVAAAFLQRADSARSCRVSEIQLTGGSMLQLDQCRDQRTSFGVWYPAHPPALHLAGRLCQQACCSSRQLAGSRVSRPCESGHAPGQLQNRPIFYGELIRQPNFHHVLGKIWRRD
jgi:hypothetical protein